MARITATVLREYIGLSSSVDVDQFIADADVLITAKMGATPSIGEPLATLIEKNLGAHLYTIARENGGLSAKKVGESSESYAKVSGSGISSTRFGQAVLSLDTTGAFTDMIDPNKRKAQFRVVTSEADYY